MDGSDSMYAYVWAPHSFNRVEQVQRATLGVMAMPWSQLFYIMSMVWMALSGWVSSCLSVANEIARALRSGDMGPFHVG